MLTILLAVILGIVEGLTEFIPVSSTGHMILTTKLLGVNDQSELLKTFEIMIQLGAILAITVVYLDRIKAMLGLSYTSVKQDASHKKGLNFIHIGLGIAPALITAYIAKDWIKELFSAEVVLTALVVGGVFLWFAEWFGNKKKSSAETLDHITYKQALLIGLFQILSVLWPGFSRSGSTISGGMISGVSYRASADFSFLLAIPIMIAASGYELLDSYPHFTWDVMAFFGLGFLISFAVAYLVVVLFLKHIQRIKLKYFAIYRFLLAGLFWYMMMR